MLETKYWTADLAIGDYVFILHDDGTLARSTVSDVTTKTFFLTDGGTPFDKLTARNAEGCTVLPYDTEHRESFKFQRMRAQFAEIDVDSLSDVQVRFMLAAFQYARRPCRTDEHGETTRDRLKGMRPESLSDEEIAYMLAGMKMSKK